MGITYKDIKAVCDVTAASVLIILLFPLMILIGFTILCSMGPPVIFIQQRPGLNGIIFNIFKFRTMNLRCSTVCDQISDTHRITNLGQFLRQTSLDELPELYNILKGEMSFVGPRPLLVDYIKFYNNREARRHEVKPGLTGWAQVNGRNLVEWHEKFEFDVWYVENKSFLLDIRIIFLTVVKVLTREGVYSPGGNTMRFFRGSHCR